MNAPLELTGLTKIFETPAGPFIAVKDVSAEIRDGEFVCILGHSGCGKSTVLSMIAGLERATLGGVVVDGTEVREPGADRAVVFQSPCLLPWLTARQNAELGLGPAERGTRIDRYFKMVGIGDAADRLPAEISLGTQQCVSLVRALAREPRFLLLDEPFSQLDSLTRFELQDMLLRVWEDQRRNVIMVTHDIDEALYLADRLILMTDGPEATVGQIIDVQFLRPRTRAAVLEHLAYYQTRERVLDFLEHHAQQSRPSALDRVLRARVQQPA
jgi:nitrate/nitrite transport system ATP-binding protein